MNSSILFQSYFVITNFRIGNKRKQQKESKKVCKVIFMTVFLLLFLLCVTIMFKKCYAHFESDFGII